MAQKGQKDRKASKVQSGHKAHLVVRHKGPTYCMLTVILAMTMSAFLIKR